MSALESRIIDDARQGKFTRCGDLGVDDLAETQNPAVIVRAALIRELLRGDYGVLDARGVRIGGARIDGPLELDNVVAEVGLHLADCAVDEVVQVSYAKLPYLRLTGCRVPGLSGDGLRVSDDLSLEGSRIVASAGADCAVRLPGAIVSGDLDLTDAEIKCLDGSGVLADRITVDNNAFFGGANVVGGGGDGAIRLPLARVGGVLFFSGAKVAGTFGSALVADRIQVGGGLDLRGVTLTGSGAPGVVVLPGATVDGRLSFGATAIKASLEDSTARPVGRLAFDLREVTVKGALLPPTALLGCNCADDRDEAEPARGWNLWLAGFTFADIENADRRQWLHLIRYHSQCFHAQPYQHLAALEKAAGNDGRAREVLIAQQRDLVRLAAESFDSKFAKIRHIVWGAMADFGYRPLRLLWWLFATIVLTASLGVIGGVVETRPGHHAVERVASIERPSGEQCSKIEMASIGLDRGLPLGGTGLRSRCDVDTGPRRGQVVVALIWLFQALIWSLAALTIAGYTNLVRKVA